MVEIRTDAVVKRYRSSEYDQPHREWRALTLLDEYAPGTAPVPLTAELDADPPAVTMSRLSGEAVSGPVADQLADGIAEAILKVHHAIPAQVLASVPPRAGHPVEFLHQIRAAFAAVPAPSDPVVAEAFRAATAWTGQADLEATFAEPGREVFGTGDGNLANFLWDGDQVRVIDFEYSGRSDRSFELAEVFEHISVWQNDAAGLSAVLERVHVDADESRKFMECRRLHAAYWLVRSRQLGEATRFLALV
jgi:thiamine kinase-like enzyme